MCDTLVVTAQNQKQGYFEEFFTYRINRRSFFICFILLNVLLIFGVHLFALNKGNSLLIDSIVITVWIVWVIFWILIAFSLMIKRLHDIGLSYPWSLLFIIPGVNILFLFFLMLYPGSPKKNKFGKTPKSFDLKAVLGLS